MLLVSCRRRSTNIPVMLERHEKDPSEIVYIAFNIMFHAGTLCIVHEVDGLHVLLVHVPLDNLSLCRWRAYNYEAKNYKLQCMIVIFGVSIGRPFISHACTLEETLKRMYYVWSWMRHCKFNKEPNLQVHMYKCCICNLLIFYRMILMLYYFVYILTCLNIIITSPCFELLGLLLILGFYIWSCKLQSR